MGIIFLRNPNLEWHEKYIVIPSAVVFGIVFLLGGTIWVFSHTPPAYALHLEFKSYKGRPCCWQVLLCDGLDKDDYELFTCKSSTWESDEWGDLTKSTLKAGGVAYDTCDAMKDYAASQRRLLADSSSPYDHLEL